jgi:hypothetical protein
LESNDSCGIQSAGTCVVDDACQFLSASENHQEVCVVCMLNLSHAIGSTRSHLNTVRVELGSHADTYVVGLNDLIIHKHPNVIIVSGFDPSQPP